MYEVWVLKAISPWTVRRASRRRQPKMEEGIPRLLKMDGTSGLKRQPATGPNGTNEFVAGPPSQTGCHVRPTC